MKHIEKFVNTLIIFFELWGSYHYENRIGAVLAWELARLFEEHNVLNEFEKL